MAKISDDLYDKQSQVGGSDGVGRGSGNELPPSDGEGCARMEWFSFERLDEFFDIESDGPDGCWVEWGDFKGEEGENNSFYGKKHSEESRKQMSESYKKNYENGFHPRRKPCVYRGVWYPSQLAASQATGVPKMTISRHVRGLNKPR